MNRSTSWLLSAAFMLLGCSVSGQMPPPVPEPSRETVPADPSTNNAAQPSAEPAVLIGAGDIAGCDTEGDILTADILDTIPGTVFTVGDHAYPTGTTDQFRDCYDRSWGRHKARTRPVPGNHDYMTQRGRPYYSYFGEAAGERGKGYYSYDIGGWHIIALNSEIDTHRGSTQEKWLRADLAANPSRCTIAYWHRPLFSSVREERRFRVSIKPLWDALYEAGAEIVLAGHDHVYERFAPQRPDGVVDRERGIRQFIVGTGGRSLYPFDRPLRNSEMRVNNTYGVLKLTLQDGKYDWDFITPGNAFSDSGSGECH